MAERIQKILANTGMGSRRELEGWIEAGEVKLNGQQAKLGDRAKHNDRLIVKGRFYKVVAQSDSQRNVLLYHKPVGEVTTHSDPENRKTVFDRLPRLRNGRWISVGRLDINTLGLLLITDDGHLANLLMHPSSQVEREYAVRVNGKVTKDVLDRLASGVLLEDGEARFDRVWYDGGEGSNQWYRVVVTQGRNRLVRRLWEAQGLLVSRLIRVRYGPILLPKSLPRGRFEALPAVQLAQLEKAVGLQRQRAGDTLRVIPVHPRHKRKARRR